MPVSGQSLDWSYDYSLAESSMAIGISESAIDQITVEGNTFPVGGAIGVFYQNQDNEYVCSGSIIWDYQSNVIPVWGGGSGGLSDGQEFSLFAFVNGVTYTAEIDSDDTNLYTYNPYAFISVSELNFTYFSVSEDVVGCMDPSACNYDFYATIAANETCSYPVLDYLNCDGSCESDYDEDGVCDINEIYGCTEIDAYNYSPIATENYGCLYPGCMDENALNFDPNANNPDNSCEYPVFELDWSYDNTDQDATIAISTLTGLETNDFTEVVVGAFYANSFLSDSIYTGLSCASSYDGAPSFASMTVYADEVYTTEKDGFELQEELIYIVLYNGQEYFATASYMESFNAGWGLLELVSENIYIPYSLYIIEELTVQGPVGFGCTDPLYVEYDESANIDNGTCFTLVVEGCMDVAAANFNSEANTEDDSCQYPGCTDSNYLEYWTYNPIESSISEPAIIANLDDGSCLTLIVEGCTDASAFNYDLDANINDNSCIAVVEGCTDETMFNFDPAANTDYDGALCIPFVYGCMDYSAYNYYPFANTDDGSCYYQPGCTSEGALNYNADADYDDGFIAYINGYEIARSTNIDSSNVLNTFGFSIGEEHEAKIYQNGLPEGFLINEEIIESIVYNGENCLAIQVINYSNGMDDMTANFWLSFSHNQQTSGLHDWFYVPMKIDSSSLPIFVINTNNQVIPNDEKITVELGIIKPGTSLFDAFSSFIKAIKTCSHLTAVIKTTCQPPVRIRIHSLLTIH